MFTVGEKPYEDPFRLRSSCPSPSSCGAPCCLGLESTSRDLVVEVLRLDLGDDVWHVARSSVSRGALGLDDAFAERSQEGELVYVNKDLESLSSAFYSMLRDAL